MQIQNCKSKHKLLVRRNPNTKPQRYEDTKNLRLRPLTLHFSKQNDCKSNDNDISAYESIPMQLKEAFL